MKNKWKERRIYFFTCSGCGEKAQSFKRRRARNEMCRCCRKVNIIDPNQQTLKI